VRRLRGFAIFLGGLLLMVVGIGMWRSPELNWQSFVSEWSTLMNEMNRLFHDPFGVLGVVVLIIGLLIAYHGVRRLILG
jgi:uncharacterized membrane protein